MLSRTLLSRSCTVFPRYYSKNFWEKIPSYLNSLENTDSLSKTINKEELIKIGTKTSIETLNTTREIIKELDIDEVTTTVTFNAGIVQLAFSATTKGRSK